MKLHNYFWGSCIFALLVLLVSCLSNDKKADAGNPRVATPSLQMSPDRTFNNGPILITLATATPDASIYYTLDGSAPSAANGTLYTGPFNLEFDDTNDASFRGCVNLRAIGIKENHINSAIAKQIFQLFPSEPIKANGVPVNGGPKTGTGTGYYAPVTVTLALTDGYISDVTFVNVDNGQTPEFWAAATKYAREFFTVMNSWDFIPVVSGASYSGGGVKEAAKDAIDKILDE
ncbi:MAG: chitobiase/beta-hexosaminidase C-terminal domain-containing protein [Spirochaetaceae bacterium]|jgi:hypothetical protein|nr:chitobiase/beta-hexosaminidase C-terminal domain-containing protein [Spirochaetaceae bacterium]